MSFGDEFDGSGDRGQPIQDYGQRGWQPDRNDPQPGYPDMGMPYPTAPPQPSGMSGVTKTLLGVGCGCLSLIGIAMVAFVIWAVSLPESGTLPGAQLSEVTNTYLASHELLEPDEKVIFLNDISTSVDNSELCFFTDRRIVYHKEGNLTNRIDWDEVDNITSREEFLSYIITVKSKSGDYLKCDLAVEGAQMYDAMLENWEGHKSEIED